MHNTPHCHGGHRCALSAAIGLGVLLAAAGCARFTDMATHHATPAQHAVPVSAAAVAERETAAPIPLVGVLTGDLHGVDALLAKLGPRRAYVIGELHDNYAHHLAQRDVIEALHADGAPLAIGIEWIQRPFQPVLDDYIAQRIDEATLLKRTEYFNRWGFDFRLYRPIFRYAREQQLPLIALNAAQALSAAVSKQPYEQLPEAQRAQLPEFRIEVPASYRQRLQDAFAKHPKPWRGTGGAQQADRFEGFMRVQQLWDATMAETAVDYLNRHPDHRIVVLAGHGHVSWPGAIADRMKARLPATGPAHSPVASIELRQSPAHPSGYADALLMPASRALPNAGRLGVRLAQTDHGVRIQALSAGGAAAHAGLRAGDRLLALDGKQVDTVADVLILLLDKRPGDNVRIALRQADAVRTRQVTLMPDPPRHQNPERPNHD